MIIAFVVQAWMVWAGIVAFLVAFAVFSLSMDRKHTRDMAAVAEQLGFEFLGDVSVDGFHGTRIFRKRGQLKNVMWGKVSVVPVVLFEYEYSRGRDTETQTATAFQIQVPAFELRTRKLWHRIAGCFGYKQIRLLECPEFYRRYLVRGSSEPEVRSAINPTVMEYLTQLPHEWDWCIESNGQWLFVYRDNKPLRFRPENWSLENTFSDRRVPVKAMPEFLRQAGLIAKAFQSNVNVEPIAKHH